MPPKQHSFFDNLQKNLEGGAVQPEELIRVAKIIVEVVNGIVSDLRSDVQDAKNEVHASNGGFAAKLEEANESLSDLLSRHYELQNKLNTVATSLPKQTSKEAIEYTNNAISGLREALSKELESLRDFIGETTDTSSITARLEKLETSGESAELIRNKLELLEGEDRLDASAIKNLPEATEKVVERVVGHSSLFTLADVTTVGATDGQVLTYKASNHSWYPANAGSSSLTLTTTGTSGAATYSGGILNIPVYSAGGGSGTVTTVSVATANGFAGSVANPTTTPAITLTTSITGLLKGNGTAISAAASGDVTTALGYTPYNATNPSGYISNATGLISAGTNVTITGSGTSGSPYVINSSGGTNYWSDTSGVISPATLTDKVAIGTAASDSPLSVTNSSGTPKTPQTGTLVHLYTDGATNARITGDVYSNTIATGFAFQGRRSRGTIGTPTTPNVDDTLASFGGIGYGTTLFPAASSGAFVIKSEGSGTDTSQPTYIAGYTSPTASITALERWRTTSAGRMGIGITAPGSLLDVGGADTGTTITAASVAMLQVTNTDTTANNFSDMAFATFDLSSANIVSSKIVGIHTSHTAGAVSGDLSFLTRNAGTISEAMHITSTNSVYITSSSANAFTVGQNGLTNPAFNITANTASSATGINITSAAAAGGVSIAAISSGTNEALSLDAKGTGIVNLATASTGGFSIGGTAGGASSKITVPTANSFRIFNGTTAQYTTGLGSNAFAGAANPSASTIRFNVTNAADVTLTLNTEATHTYFNLNTSSRQHATGALTLQRDFRISGTNHTFVAASTLTDHAVLAVDFSTSAATNATITNSHAIYVPAVALGAGRTNSYGLTVNAATGATTNFAAQFLGGSIFVGNSTVIAGTPSGGGYLYVESGALKYKGSSGTVTILGLA